MIKKINNNQCAMVTLTSQWPFGTKVRDFGRGKKPTPKPKKPIVPQPVTSTDLKITG